MSNTILVNAFTTHDSVLGCILKLIRNEKKITQERFAGLVGLSTSSVSKIERGEYCFSFDFVVKASQALGIRLGDIFKAYDDICSFMLAQGVIIHSIPILRVPERDGTSSESSQPFNMPMSGRVLQQYILNSKSMNEAVRAMLSEIK